jgi:hypothetical protein
MRRAEGNAGVRLLECTSPVKNKWRIRWDVQKKEDGSASYMEEEFNHKPTDEEIRSTVTAWYNRETDKTILSGFTYEGVPVWLSSENQFNYKSAFDLATMTGGATLPVTFKFGTDSEPVYREFTILEDLTDFYTKAMRHIQDTLADGWKKKNAFDLSMYAVD